MADRSNLPRRDNEPSGEPSSLSGKIYLKDMGSRAQRDITLLEKFKVQNKEDFLKREQKKLQKEQNRLGAEFSSILEATEDFDGLRYRPRTAETRQAYELILSFVASKLGDVPADILHGATDQILEILHGPLKDFDKKLESEVIMETMSNEDFSNILSLSKKLTDYNVESNAIEQGTLDEELGVAVVFEDEEENEQEEDENEDAHPFEAKDMDDAEDRVEAAKLTSKHGKARDNEAFDVVEDGLEDLEAEEAEGAEDQVVLNDLKSRKSTALSPHDIDAFWLQRTISAHIDDVHVVQQKTNQVFNILSKCSASARDVENALMELFEYSHFDLVKLFTANAPTILYCTRLAKSSSDEERAEILKEMEEQGLEPLLISLGIKRPSGPPTTTTTTSVAPMEIDLDGRTKPSHFTPETLSSVTLLDLESMAFSQGAHLMTNKKVALPAGSFKRSKKGYEEIHIPAPKPPPMHEGETLVQIADLPAWTQLAFPNSKTLNRVQSRIYPAAFDPNENLLVCAPTGAGKTNVAMLAVLGLMKAYRDAQGDLDLSAFKIIYVAPMKALVQEMVGNFGLRLKAYGMKVAELTGDAHLNKQQLHETHMIVTTPEKWDVITRKGTDRSYTALVRLIILDEVHLLHDERGPVLEAIVARTLRHVEQTRDQVRLVGLSATLPNYQDVAAFMRVAPEHVFFFDASYRPCPLQQQYVGVTEKKALKRFQVMNQVTYDKVVEQAGANQVLIFVHSRKDTAKTAKQLRDMAIEKGTIPSFIKRESSREVLQTESDTVKDKELKELLPYGFAIHHAGMARTDRTLVEELFADGHIQVLCSTATLAWGINLPAHTVIIKGTQVYNPEKGCWVELSPQDVLQMLGRAGRPQFDTHGEGIILTSHSELQYYLSLMNTQLPIESQLIRTLPDVLNAEIVLGTITSRQEAMDWLKYTYLYVRMLRAPSLYGIDKYECERDPALEQRRLDLVHSAASILDKHLLCKYDRRTGKLVSTELGRIASHYYITHASMALYHQQLRQHSSLIDLFRVFALSHEFRYIPVREEEKLELQKLMERVPIPIKENPDEPTAKINLLLQAYVSQLKLEGFALVADLVYVTQSAQRLFRALFQMALKRGWAQLCRMCLDMSKMIERRQWSCMTPLRQFKKIPLDAIKRIERKELSWERFFDLSPEEVGEHVGVARYGKTLHRYIHQLPKMELSAQVLTVSRSLVKMDLTLIPDFQWDEKVHGAAQGFWILVSDVDDELLLYYDYFVLKGKYATEEHTLSFTVPLYEPLAPNYFISIISDSWLCSETRLAISFRNLLLPAKFPPPTELLDLQPLPVATLQPHEAMFESVTYFNPIQTQVYHSVYMTNENTLICAPPGSGKTIIIEWAILRALYHSPQRQPDQRIVYMAPYPSIAKIRYEQWLAKFKDWSVVLLTGQTTRDLQLLEKADIVVTSAAHWDALSRRWRQRKHVYQLWLFITDEIHLLSDPDVGVTMEIACSRMRFISAQRESDGLSKIRLLGMGASIANSKDIGDWLGCAPAHVYNFHPSSRPHALQIHIQGFSITHLPSLILAMVKGTYQLLSTLKAPDQQAILFVPTKSAASLVVGELMAWMTSDQTFLCAASPDVVDASKIFDQFDSQLQEALQKGIAWIHENMPPKQIKWIMYLYQSKTIQVLLATRKACWLLEQLTCYHVFILSTQYYDGHHHVDADYPIADVLHMIGRSTNQCHLMTTPVKKEHYKRYLHEPFPVESQLDQRTLLDPINAEIVTKTIDNKQGAVDYLTWTLMYRRMTLNPNYYGLTGISERHLSDFLSDLVENVVQDLVNAKCSICEEDFELLPLNLGMIAAYYYVSTETIEMFNLSLAANTKLRGLLDIVSHAAEFAYLPVSHGEKRILQKLYSHVCQYKFSSEELKFSDPHIKSHILLQAHFSRVQLSEELQGDLNYILDTIVPLLYALVDVISSQGWLNIALSAMEVCQMVVQGVWDRDSPLKQIPHFTTQLIEQVFKPAEITTVFDLMELEEKQQAELFKGFQPLQMRAVANFVNQYPNIEVEYRIEDQGEGVAQVPMGCQVLLKREEEQPIPDHVIAPLFPSPKNENWWLIIGDAATHELYGIKRVTLMRELSTRLEFVVPKEGKYNLTLYLMCDSYLGCDQEYEFKVKVAANDEDEAEGSGDEMDEEGEVENGSAGRGNEDVDMEYNQDDDAMSED